VAKPDEPEESKWPSTYGMGRPGWHIECSAMSRELLGIPLDIHGGGPDLKFPHHENEIAQSEGAFDTQLANIWMHCGPLMVDADKMSKSLGNFRTIRDTIANPDSLKADTAGYETNAREAEMLRFFIVRNHYRSIQNYTPDNLQDAQNALDRLYQTLLNVAPEKVEIDWSSPEVAGFRDAMNDDFNTSGAVAALFELAGQVNRTGSASAAGLLKALGGVLGLLQVDPAVYSRCTSRYIGQTESSETLDNDSVDALVEERTAAKKARDFARADAIREQLRQAGVELEDKPGGVTQWRRA
jgi:cysteinyl-tRNA synthetase